MSENYLRRMSSRAPAACKHFSPADFQIDLYPTFPTRISKGYSKVDTFLTKLV